MEGGKEMKDEWRQCWRTPDDFFSVVNNEFHFDIDVAANAVNTKCKKFISISQDGLSSPWFKGGKKAAWCNPGFSSLGLWAEKAWHETRGNQGCVAVIMGLISCSTEWWAEWALKAAEIRLLAPRVQFEPPPGVPKSSNARENCLLIFREEKDRCFSPQIRTWNWKSLSK